MFKKLLQIATAFGVLLAGYAGYVHVFALVAGGLSRTTAKPLKLLPAPSRTHLKAIALARQAFGPDFFASAEDLPIRLYNAERGFWMYARDYVRHKDGKHVDFTPFAIIMTSGDGRVLKTAVSDKAEIELDQAFDLSPKPGASNSQRVVHARIVGNVHLRDDKGTPKNTADDLRIGPLDWIEYDEAKLQITSDSDVNIEDDVYRVTGTGLLIKLRPKEDDGLPHPPGSPTGFEDAQTAYLFKNVHIVINDVGAGGILPGTSKAGAAAVSATPKPSPARPREATPLDLRCDGLMQVDFPRRLAPWTESFVGPPDRPGPTLAQFSRNVEVVRGKALPDRDQLNCDHLRLTLVPPDKPRNAAGPPAAGEVATLPLSLDVHLADSPAPVVTPVPDPTAPSPSAKGPMSDLALKEAVASGHNVRLVSAAQDIKVRCNELIYKKQHPGRPELPSEQPDTTYFRGDRTTGLIVEKLDRVGEGPNRGQVSTFTTIRAIDATIFDDHRGNDYAVVVASGPGEMEARPGPGLNGPIERTAHWNDRLTIRPVTAGANANAADVKPGSAAAAPPPVRKRVTLTGKPGFRDIPAKATLDGRDRLSTIDIWLKPKAPIKTQAGPAAPAQPGGGSYEIEHLFASNDVLLTTPGRTLTARNDLQAVFIPLDGPPRPAASAPPPVKPAVPQANAAANPANPAVKGAPAAAPAPEPAKPTEPEARASADRVWAQIFLKPAPPPGEAPATTTTPAAGSPSLFGGNGSTGDRKAEIDEVRLRGTVVIHQEPAAGKARGTEIAGEAVDLFNQGGKGSKFIVYSADPKPRAGLKTKDDIKAAADDELFRPLAMVDSDEMVIRGRRIGLNQATDEAWVDGNGSLTQLAPTGFLSEKSEPAPKPTDPKNKDKDKDKDKGAAETKKNTSPMTVFFSGFPNYGKGMRFTGRSTDPTGRVVARAEFYKDVHAESEEFTVDCQDLMRTYFDRTVKLARAAPSQPQGQGQGQEPAQAQAAPEPKAEIALIECVRKVVVVNTRRDPLGQSIVQRQRIVGDYLTYERATGKFKVPGEGMVYLYERDGPSNPPGAKPRQAAAPAGRVIRPTSGPDRPTPVRRGGAVVGRTEARSPSDTTVIPRSPARRPAAPPATPLVLTQVHFTEEMRGRYGTGQGADKAEDRNADFFGDVEAMRARVAGPDDVFDFDRPPADATFLTSQIMQVVSEPAPPGAAEKGTNAPARYLLRAWENAFASTADRTIQADAITYDSRSDLFHAYGEDGRDIIIAQQGQPGQPATVAPGQMLKYNLKTGQSQLADPKAFSFIDPKTAYRAAPVGPPSDKLKPRLPPRKPFINRTNNLERKGYTGS